ncbi:phage baseplate assembly protein domain-containing protein [Acinetobacter higginsii]|uniref:phage baseplate assembly protein domain-containing protein n=1 Tax=Acinetobacter higginsii TaxID=70347 RepID=UPI001F4B86DD|nr:phage baseplate assembly protein [Acinetobacter higginsii]MCH7381365.1 phage baseplate assembly protein [Acinetobacter higginsii]
MIEKMFHGLMNLLGVGRGVIAKDDGDAQLVQVTFNKNETKDNIPRYTDYGFQSAPPDGHNALTLFFGGNKSNGVVIATNHPKSRKRGLKRGEVCISDDQGQMVFLSREGITLIDKAGTKVELNGDGTGGISSSSTFTINGVEFLNGIAKGVDFQAGTISQIEHQHIDSRGGDTSPPKP